MLRVCPPSVGPHAGRRSAALCPDGGIHPAGSHLGPGGDGAPSGAAGGNVSGSCRLHVGAHQRRPADIRLGLHHDRCRDARRRRRGGQGASAIGPAGAARPPDPADRGVEAARSSRRLRCPPGRAGRSSLRPRPGSGGWQRGPLFLLADKPAGALSAMGGAGGNGRGRDHRPGGPGHPSGDGCLGAGWRAHQPRRRGADCGRGPDPPLCHCDHRPRRPHAGRGNGTRSCPRAEGCGRPPRSRAQPARRG